MIAFAAMVDGPICPTVEAEALRPVRESLTELVAGGGVGAVLRFEGVVRRAEAHPSAPLARRDLVAIEYQSYDPMAQRETEKLANEVAIRHGLLAIAVLHSRGRVAPGECSFVLQVWSAHRAEALTAMGEFIDRLKRDVPIWKHPIWPESASDL